jgi:hypothetical protein
MQELNRNGAEFLPYPLQRGLVRNLSTAAEAAGRADLVPLWAGQSAGLSTCTDVVTFLASLVKEVADVAGPITEWNARHRQKPLSIAAHSYRSLYANDHDCNSDDEGGASPETRSAFRDRRA